MKTKRIVYSDETSIGRVLNVMRDYKPHHAREISKYAGCRDNTAVKNLHILRKRGHKIETIYLGEKNKKRTFVFQMKKVS